MDTLLQRLPPAEAARLHEVWELAGASDPLPSPSASEVEQALGVLFARVEDTPSEGTDAAPVNGLAGPSRRARPLQHRRPDRATRRGARRPARRLIWMALAGLLVVAGTFAWWSRPVTQVAGLGERLTVELPDGSHVELNSGSQLRYARWFDDERSVQLVGEAFFDVVEDERLFTVATFNAQVEVLGTRFGVRAWPGDLEDGTTIALEAGRVSLAPAGHPARAVILKAGEMRRLSEGDVLDLQDSSSVSVDDAIAWRHGDLVYRDQRLGVVLQDVERRFGVAILVQPERLLHKRVGLALREPANAESVIRDLSLALGLSYRETSAGFELFARTAHGLAP